MHRNSITLCMIARDAEETVGRAIKSALAIVDEVVVVDTGSADNTRLIVEGYGARVIEYDWDDDFAAARNTGIDAAYGDWILVLDADEVLESVRPVEVGKLIGDDKAIAYYARVLDADETGRTSASDQLRLFRNHASARYRFPVHEQITPALAELAGEQGREFRASRLKVRQQPGEGRHEQARRARNQRLLQRAIADSPGEPWFRYQLARGSSVVYEDRVLPAKGFGEMLALLESAIGQVRSRAASETELLGYVADLYARYVDALLAAERVAEAVAAAEEAQRVCGDGARIRYAHARSLVERARELADEDEREALLAIASAHLHTLLRGRTETDAAAVADRYFGPYPQALLGHVELERGEAEAARTHFREAMRACPEHTAALCGLALIARAEGRVHDALQIYMKVIAVDPRDAEAWVGGIETQLELGFEDNARSWIGRLQQALPEHPRLALLQARLRSAAPAEAGS